MANVSIFVALLCSWLIPGLQCELINDEQYLTVLIDFEKYRHETIVRRRLTDGISTIRTISKECSGLENEEYRMCGKKCVLNCRNDSVVGRFLISKEECDTNKCVEGCFCKDGFVRYHNKCVPISECPVRRNKAVDFVTEANNFDNIDKSHMKIQNSTQIASQIQAALNLNQAQLNKNASNPKIFGFFNRPGCGFLGCMPFSTQQYDESEDRKEGDDSEEDQNRVYDHDPNRTPVHVHIHDNRSTTEATATSNKDKQNKKGAQKAQTHSDREENDEPDDGDSGGSAAAIMSGGFAAIPVAFPGFGIPNGIGGVPNFGLPGNMGNFPGYGNPASFPNFNNQPNFGGLQQPPMPVKESVVPTVSGSNIHQVLSSIGSPSINYNATTRTTTINYGLYSVTYNPNGTRTLHVFGLGTYTFIADGTIISSEVGPKISLPFDMNVEIPLSAASNNREPYDDVEDDENDIEEQQNDQSSHGHQNEEEQEELVEEEVEKEQEQEVESEETYDPPMQSDNRDQSSAAHYSSSPPLYPNPYQYPAFMNPNMPPYSMQTPVGPMQPGFNPYNYYTAPPQPLPPPLSPPSNLQENNMVTPKPIKKKPAKNSSNKQTPPTENQPNMENDSYVHIIKPKPTKPNRKPTTTPSQINVSGQTYTGASNPYIGQNQNIPIGPINSFNLHPFGNQFSMPFYANSDTPFLNNYMNPSNGGFNGANEFSSQFGQTSPLQPYGNNNPFVNKHFGAAPYQNNPTNFNVPNNPYAYQTMNQFNQKFNGFPQYFTNPSSNSN